MTVHNTSIAECPGYQSIGYSFTLLNEFGCLSNTQLPPQYCLAAVGPAISAYELNRTIDMQLCTQLQGAGCCFASFVDVEIAAINLKVVGTDVIWIMRNVSNTCSAMGVALSTDSCPGGAHDPCQVPFNEIADECLTYALDFLLTLPAAMTSNKASAQLCTDPCYNSTLKLGSILVQHRT